MILSTVKASLMGGGRGFRPITLEKKTLNYELERKARTCPDIFRVDLVHACNTAYVRSQSKKWEQNLT